VFEEVGEPRVPGFDLVARAGADGRVVGGEPGRGHGHEEHAQAVFQRLLGDGIGKGAGVGGTGRQGPQAGDEAGRAE
jgi:hypothetical protein